MTILYPWQFASRSGNYDYQLGVKVTPYDLDHGKIPRWPNNSVDGSGMGSRGGDARSTTTSINE